LTAFEPFSPSGGSARGAISALMAHQRVDVDKVAA
jgi:hypothetical protein